MTIHRYFDLFAGEGIGFDFSNIAPASLNNALLNFSMPISFDFTAPTLSAKSTTIPRADSVAGDNSTTATVDVNGQVTGTIEDAADQDFYRVDLKAGVAYEFFQLRGGDNPMEDPYLRLYSPDGVTELAENDDILNADGEQATRNSKITFTPTEDGAYFLVADRWDPAEGPDNSVGPGDYTIYVNADGYRPEGTLDELAFFLTDQFDIRAVWDQTTITYNVSALPAAVQILAVAALELWEDITPLNFVQTTANAEITFQDTDDGAYAATATTNGNITNARINISNTQWVEVHGTDFNSYTFETYIHEVGHALGLGHGGPYNGNATYGVDNVYARDLANFSVMSYNQQTPGADAAFQGTPRLVLGPQIVDIIAIHDLYGANPDGTRADGTVYGFNSNVGGLFDFSDFNSQGIRPPAISIYDTGGYDTLDLSGYSAPQRISLIAETFSDIGNNTNLGGNVPLINIISIARDTVIEAAIGGSGNDDIIGNDSDNNLQGRSGADRLEGGLGNDVLSGGGGDDVFVITEGGNSDTITDFITGDVIELADFELKTFTDVMAAATQDGVDVVIDMGGGETLTLENVQLAALSEADFDFVELQNPPTPPVEPAPVDPANFRQAPTSLIDALDHIYFDFTPLF